MRIADLLNAQHEHSANGWFGFMTKQAPKVFLREATGLVKELSLRHILAFNLINVGYGLDITYMLTSLTLYPGGDPVLATLIAALLFVPLGVCYAMLLMATPRAGGDYVFVSRALHPALGYILNFTFIVWILFYSGAYMNWMFTLALAPAFTIIGSIENVAAVSSIGALMSSSTFVIAASIVIMILLGLIATFARKALLALTVYSVYAGVLSTIIIAIVFAMSSQAQFIHNFNLYAAPLTNSTDYYHSVIASAHANYTSMSWPATVGLIPIGAFFFIYISIQQVVGGEIKNVQRSAWMGILFTFVISGLFIAGLCWISVQVMGYNFLVAIANVTTLPIPPYYSALVGVLMGGNALLLWVTEILFAGWYICIPVMNFFLVSRYMLASSMDGITPGVFARVSDRFHTPYVGIWIVVVASIIMAIIYTLFANLFAALSAFTGELLGAYLLICLACIAFPFRRGTKEIFEASTVKWRIAGVPVMSISGGLATIVLLAIGYTMLTNSVYGVNSFWSLVAVVLTVVAGLLIFIASYAYKKSKGLDLMLAFRQIPPE